MPTMSPFQMFLEANAQRHTNRQNEMHNDLAQQQLEQHQQEIDNTVKSHQDQMGLMKNQLAIEQAKAHAALLGHMQDFVNQNPSIVGSNQETAPSVIPGGQPQSSFVPNPGFSADPSGNSASVTTDNPLNPSKDLFPNGFPVALNSPEMQMQRAAKAAGMQTSAEESAKEPFRSEASRRQFDTESRLLGLRGLNQEHLAEVQHGFDSADLNRKLAVEQGIAQMKERGETGRTGMQVQGHLEGIKLMHDLDLNDNLVGGVMQSLEDGKPISPKIPARTVEAAQIAMKKAGLTPLTKEQSTQFDKAAEMEGVLKSYIPVIEQYSRDAPGGGMLAKATGGLLTPVIPGSDIKAKLDDLNSRAGALAQAFEAKNRAVSILATQTKGIFDPGATVQQNKEKLNNHIQQVNSAIMGGMSNLNPTQVNNQLMKRGVTLFGTGSNKKYRVKGDDQNTYTIPYSKAQEILKDDPTALTEVK